MKKNKKRKKELKVELKSDYDPNGSYTGNPKEKGDKIIQDADDL